MKVLFFLISMSLFTVTAQAEDECFVLDYLGVVSESTCRYKPGSIYHENGKYAGKRGFSWYYEDGTYAGKHGFTWNYQSGQVFGKSGFSWYHENGEFAGRDEFNWYYSNGQKAGRNGFAWYKSNGERYGVLDHLSETEQLEIVLFQLLD